MGFAKARSPLPYKQAYAEQDGCCGTLNCLALRLFAFAAAFTCTGIDTRERADSSTPCGAEISDTF